MTRKSDTQASETGQNGWQDAFTNTLSAYNFARRLKTLRGLMPYEYICKVWTLEPQRFKIDPTHQIPGLNIYSGQ